MRKPNGKVAHATGAARGMGESHARRFTEEDAKVVVTDVNEQRDTEIAAELGENALCIRHDIASLAD